MKKRISLFIATVVGVVAMPVATFAVSPTTDVTGVVTHNSAAVQGANVTVTCNGHNGNDTTDSTGTYLVVFSAADCPNGETATVTAQKDGLSGSNSGPVNGVTNKLNVAVVDVSVVPEFGMIAGVGASLIGAGAFLVIRRRQISGHQA